MVLKQLSSEGLESLRIQEQVDLLDAIDTLRSQGISQHVSLPQIIVCGDQSSGKSSVLESISGIPFPVRSNLCTRFPTEVILRKADSVSVRISIVPHHSRSKTDRASLSAFREDLESFEAFPALIENAKAAMGIATLGRAFAKDILRVEIEGPDRPQLTIVDLPGLIHSENKQQSESDVQLITDVVTAYMKEPRSVILAVVSAKNDYANQVVLKLARQADPAGRRTLGVITKPDTLVRGSESERMFVSLAANQDIHFHLGWHVLRNTDTESEGSNALEDRNRVESEFFSGRAAWGSLSPTATGIAALRTRLSELLLHQIGREMPAMLREITAKSLICEKQLIRLGDPRTNPHEQTIHLIKISQSFQALTQAGTDGSYDNVFFDNPETKLGYRKRFRAVVQSLSHAFAADMVASGQKWNLDADSPDSRELFLEKVTRMIDRVRGRELACMFNPMVISDLFKEQSSPWEELVKEHMGKLWTAARNFLHLAVKHVSDATTSKAILEKVIGPAMDKVKQELEVKTGEILKPHQTAHPITYNQSFLKELREVRCRRQRKHFKAILESERQGSFGHNDSQTERLLARLMEPSEKHVNEQAAVDAMDCLEAYYTVALERFIDDISVQVVEMCLIAHVRDLLSPLSISLMTKAQVADIAGETKESRDIRKALKAKLDVLQKGAAICQRFAGDMFLDKEETASITPEEDSDFGQTQEGPEEHSVTQISTENDNKEDQATDKTGTLDELSEWQEPAEDDPWGSLKLHKKGKKNKKKRQSARLLDESDTVPEDTFFLATYEHPVRV